jgi:hypothetical protein
LALADPCAMLSPTHTTSVFVAEPGARCAGMPWGVDAPPHEKVRAATSSRADWSSVTVAAWQFSSR